MVLLQPVTPVLQVLLQGKTLTLLESANGEYTGDFDTDVAGATDNDDRAEEHTAGVTLGTGYLEIRGSKGYEEGLLGLVDALCLVDKGLATADDTSDDIPTPAEYNAYTGIEDILGTILDIVFGIVDGIAGGPVEYIADNLAGLLYFLVSDNLAVLVDNVLALVWGLLEVVEPITGEKDALIQKLLNVDLDSYVTIEGLLDLINGLIEGNKDFELTEVKDDDGNVTGYTYTNGDKTENVALDAEGIKDVDGKKYITVKTGTLDLVITVDMLKTLIAEIGEYTITTSYRTDANTSLVKDNELVDKDGNSVLGEDGNLDTTKVETGKIATVTGSKTYFVNGLLTFAIDEVLPMLADEENEDAVINQVIDYLSEPGAVKGVIDFLNNLTTKYVVEFFAIEEPEVALQKIAVQYASATGHSVTKAETEQALANLDALLAEILPMVGLLEEGETLADLVSGLLLTDKMTNTIVGALAGVFGGLNQNILDIIEIVADALGEEIDITVETYKKDADIADFFGDATTWAEVIENYTKYEYTYITKDTDGKDVTNYYYSTDNTLTELDISAEDAEEAEIVTLTKTLADVHKSETTGEGDEAVTKYAYTYGEDKTEVLLEAKEVTTEDNKLYATIDGAKVELTKVTVKEQATKAVYDYAWGLDAETDVDTKIDKFIAVLTSFLAPLDFVLEVLLAGGTKTGNAEDADAISAFEEINIMGGSGYNYAIIPLMEALGVPAEKIKTQTEYEATFASQGTLGYILDTVLTYVVDGLENGAVNFVLGIIANLAYTISKDGLTTIVGNLIAPVSAIIKSIEGVLPVAIVIDINAALDDSDETSLLNFKIGDEVAAAGYNVGLTLDLNGSTLEDLIDTVIAKYASDFGLNIDISFRDIAAGAAKTDADGNIIYTDSKVNSDLTAPAVWDILNGTWGKNISGDNADTIITLLDMILTTETINGVLDKVLKDKTLDEVIDGLMDGKLAVLKDVANDAINDPTALVDTVIKVLAATDSTVDDIKVLYDAIASAEYTYNDEVASKDDVELALNKLDAVLNNAIDDVFAILVDLDNMPELVTDLANSGHTSSITDLVNYVLGDMVFTDDIINTVFGALVGIFAGMDEETFNTVNDLLDQILGMKIDLATFVNTGLVDTTYLKDFAGSAKTWKELGDANIKYAFTYEVTNADGKAETKTVYLDKDATTYTDDDNITHNVTAKNGDDGKQETKVVLTNNWGLADAATAEAREALFVDLILEIVAPFNKVLEFLFRGENLVILIDDLQLKGGNGWANVIVPLGMALGEDIAVTDSDATAVDCVEKLLGGILNIVDKIGAAPINTIVDVVAGLSYFLASDGVEEAVEGILAPITGFLSLLDEIITLDDVNAILKNIISMDLNDIADIAGDYGEDLVAMLNDLIGGVEITDEVTGETYTANLLPDDFFMQIAQYAVDYEANDVVTLAEGETGYDYQPEHKYVTDFTVDGADGLMYVLSTVCSDDFLQALAAKLNIDTEGTVGGIILGLAGKQDNLVDIIVTLLTDYTIEYVPYTRPELNKIDVEHNAPMNDDNLETALAALDPIIAAVIGMLVEDADTLEGLVTGLIEDVDLANKVMGLLVPVLAGIDLDDILGYVKELTNLDLDLAPQAFVQNARFGSELATFIGTATTWAEVRDAHFTAVEWDAEGKATKYEINEGFNWNLKLDEGFDGLVNFLCDLLMPLDVVFELLLTGEEIIAIPDYNEDGTRGDDIRIKGGEGYNYAIIPLLEAFGIEALTEADYIALAKGTDDVQGKGHFYPIITALIDKVETILDAPVETLLPMLANIFYFIGTDGINNIAENLLAFANVLLEKIDPVFHIGVKVDLAADKIFETEIGDEEGKNVPAGVNVNVDPDDLIALVNDLLADLKVVDIDGDGEKDPLGISLDINWLEIAAQMAAAKNAYTTDKLGANITVWVAEEDVVEAEDGTLTTKMLLNGTETTVTLTPVEGTDPAVVEIPTAQMKVDDTGAVVPATWYNIIGDAEDTFTTLINTILTEENTYAIAQLVEGLLGDNLDSMDGVDENGVANDEVNVKGLIYDIIYEENGLKELISAVVLLLSGQYDINTYPVLYKFLGVLTYFDGENAGKQTTLNNAITKLDAIITREVVELLPMFVKEDATGILGDIRTAATNSTDLSGMIDYLLNTLLFTEENYDKLIATIVKAISGALTEDLCGTLNELLGIDLAPKAFADATENAAIKAYVGEAKTWADVWTAHSDADGNAVAYTWNLAGDDDKLSATEFIDAVLALLKPLNPVLDFILANGSITLLPDEDGAAAVSLPGGDAYNTALVPLFKALGVVLDPATTSTEALDKLVAGILGDQTNTENDGLVEKLGAAPLNTILELVAGLSYLLANDNLEPLIKNLLAPVFSILDLLEPVISRDQIDTILSAFLVIGGESYGLTDIIEIGNNGGANLVAMLNNLIGGLEVKDANGDVVDTISLLPENFFVELSKYAVDVTDPAGLVDPTDVGTVVTTWTYDAAETLMYILDTVLSDNFLQVLANVINPDAAEGDTLTTILTGLADKEMPVVELILMLLENYTVSYTKIPQADLEGTAADYSAFENGKDEDNNGKDDNVEAIEEALPDAITALDALLGTVLSLLGQDSDLGALVDGLIADADLGKLIMNALVPALAGMDLDDIIGYVNDLTNLDLDINPQAFATGKFGSKLADFIGDAETWAEVRDARFDVTYKEDGETIDTVTMKEYDFGLATLEDVVNFAADLLMPLDIVFQVLLCGEQIIALEDEDTTRRADIRINGGYGYNYAIVPLLEALGVDALSQDDYEVEAQAAGSSIKPVLDMIVTRVDTILAAPISEVLGLVANLFYFIGSEGINTIVANLVAPATELLDAVCEVYPISIKVAIEDGKFVADFDIENKKGLAPGLTFDISADALATLLEGIVADLKIDIDGDGEADELGLTLDLNWLEIAAAMAKRDGDKIAYTESAMVYGYNGTTADGEGNDPYQNISGEAADALVTLLNVILTDANVAVIKDIVLGLLGDAQLNETIKGLIDDVLSDREAIINLLGTVILVLTGKYDVATGDMQFKFLGDVDYNVADADTAIETLDRLIGKAVPVVLPLIAGEDVEDGSLMDTILDAAANVPDGTPVLTHIINTLLNDMLFTQDMMNTVTDLVVGTLGGALNEGLCTTLNDLLGIDLSPAGFEAAANNEALTQYFAAVVTRTGACEKDADGNDIAGTEALTWVDVQNHYKTETELEDGSKKTTYGTIFAGVDTKDEFLNNIYDVLRVAEPVLAFLLTGGDLEIAEGYDVDNIKLLGNEGYENAIYYLFRGLGLDQMGATWISLDADNDDVADFDAVTALSHVIDYVFALVERVGEQPFDTILVLVANLSYLIANDGVEVILSNLVSPVLSLVDALEATISRAELDALIEALVPVDLLGKPLNITNILTIAGDNGKILVDLINDLLPKIEIYKDSDYNADGTLKEGATPTHVINALPDTFFVDLAKAAIEVDEPAGYVDPDDIGALADSWHVETGDALMYVLKTVLTDDFLQILCEALKITEKDAEGKDNMVYGIITSLAGKDEEVLDVLLSLLVKYLVEYTAYDQQPIAKIEAISDSTKQKQFESVVENIDALIPTILSLTGLVGEGEEASLETLVTGLVKDADLGKVLMNLLVPLLADLDIGTILDYVNELTNLTIDLAPAAFAKDNFGSKLDEFIGNAKTWAEVRDARFTKTTDAEGKVTYTINAYDFGINDLNDLVNFVCDLTAPLDSILALILMGGQVEADFIASGETSVGLSLSVLDEVNVMGGMGYNYSIIPLLELLGIDADSQVVYEQAVADNHGSTLYPILTQIVNKVSGENGVLANPVSWLADILANLCYVLGNDDITTIIDNLLAPVNMLIEKVDKIVPIAIDINIADINNETENNKVVDTYIGKAHPEVEAGIHVRVSGDAVAKLLNNLLAGIQISGVALLKEDGIDLNWLELAAKAGADVAGDGQVDMSKTALDPKYDIYNGTGYSTIVGSAADTFMTVIKLVLESANIAEIVDTLGLPDEIKGLVDDIINDPEQIIDLITNLFSGKTVYQPVQNRAIANGDVDYRSYLTFTDQNADIIANNLDQLISDVLVNAGLGSIKSLISGYISNDMVNQLVDTIVGLLASKDVAPILETVKGLEFHVKNSIDEANTDDNRLVIDLTVKGFQAALAKLDLNNKHSYMKAFAQHIAGAETWADVKSLKDANINWNIENGDLYAFVKAFAGVLTPLNSVLELLLIGEGKYLNVLGLVDIAGGDGYDYAIIPLLEAFGLKSSQVKTEVQYKQAVAGDTTQLLGYVLERVAFFAEGLLAKPVDTLLTILPNLAYFLSNDGLVLTVKNLLAPVYDILNLVLPLLGIDLESYLALEELIHNIDLGIVILDNKYDFRIPLIEWYELASKGASEIKEVSTSRTNPGNAASAETWANSFKANMLGHEPDSTNKYEKGQEYYNNYINGKDITNASLFKNTQTYIVSDKGDTLTLVFTWLFDMFSTEHNREALVQWIVDFFDLKSGAEETVRYAINELFNRAEAYNSSDIIVSALFSGLGMAVVIEASLMGNVAQIQQIFKDLFGTIGNNSGCTYGAIAKIMEDLTGVWDDTVGSDEDHEDAVEDAEESLNWFQRLIKKIKEFFQKIFSIFK